MADDITPQNDPYQDTEENRDAVTAHVKKRWETFSRGRENFLWPAFRNIFFYRGKQWIRFDRMSATGWQPIRPRDPNTPLPVTNKFARVVDSVTSMQARFEPSLSFAPGSETAEDRAAADVASRAIEVVEDEVNITTHRQEGAKWGSLTGGYWRETGYDNDPAYGMVDVPMNVCPMCDAKQPLAEEMPTPADVNSAMPADAMMGGPLCEKCNVPMAEQTVPMPKGRMFIAARSVFQMFFDPSIPDWSKQRDYICQNSVDEDQAKARWTKIADGIKPDTTSGNMFMETLPTLGPNFDNGRFSSVTGGRASNSKVTENWYWALPSKTYPQGLCAVMLGKTPGQLAWFGPLPYWYTDETGGKAYFLPHVFFPQHEVPGSAWPRTVADDLADKQRERNQIEMMVRLCAMKMANGIWLIPRGSAPSNPTGHMGQVIEYNAVPGGAEPKRQPGQPINPSLIDLIGMIDEEMDDLAAMHDVLRGDRPAGITAGVSLQILAEKGESQYGPMFIKWNHAEAQWARQALAIFKQFATEERLHKIKGRDGGWEVSKFMAADIRGRVDVVAEAGITMPRSTMRDRAEFEQMVAIGLLNLADTETRIKGLELFGKLSFLPNLSGDTKRAIMEDEQFQALAADPNLASVDVAALQQQITMAQQQGVPPPMILDAAARFMASMGFELPEFEAEIDDHAIHAREHRADAKTEKFYQYPPVIRMLYRLHIAAHDFLQGQAMQERAAMGPTPNPQAGFAAPPGPQRGSRPSTSPMRGASSPGNTQGQYDEMESRVG